MPPLAAIFDWDGVVVDSAHAHERAWVRLAAETGRTLPTGHFQAGFGRKNDVIIPDILGWKVPPEEGARLGRRKEELYREELRASGIAPLPGVREFLARLSAAGVPCAVGSSTERRNIDTLLATLALGGVFRAIVTAENVTRGKPDPQVFLLGAADLGVPPERCVVFEDALAGLAAARAGGMAAVGVTTTHPAATLAAHADRVVARLDELTVADLRELTR